MDSVHDPIMRDSPHSADHRPHSERSAINTVFGFPVIQNQFQSLQSAEFQSPGQREEGLVDPRTTRHLRQAARRAAEDQEALNAGNASFTIHLENPAQDIGTSDICVEPVQWGIRHNSFQILLLPVHQTFCCSLVNLYNFCWEMVQ